MNTITFSNDTQVILWNAEVSSQISDGWFEGEGGSYGDKLWNAEATEGSNVGCTFTAGKYHFDLTDLMEVDEVVARMIKAVSKMYPGYNRQDLEQDLAEMSSVIRRKAR